MEDKDQIKELFSKKLENFEVDVNPDLWTNIASQIGATSAATGTGLSLAAKWGLGIAASSVIVTSAVLFFSYNNDSNSQESGEQQVAVVKEEKTKNLPKSKPVDKPSLINNESKENDSYVVESLNDLDTSYNEEVGETGENDLIEVDPPVVEFPIEYLDQIIRDPSLKDEQIDESENQNGERVEEVQSGGEEDMISDSKSPVIEEELDESKTTYTIESLPNIFTPDGDGINDEFFLKSDGLYNFNVVVLNSANQTVFTSQDPNFRWDGKDLRGNPIPSGNYMYYITATDSAGNPIKEFSYLTVKR